MAATQKAAAPKAHTSAVAFLLPERHYEVVQPIRQVHDKAFARWMPHINLLYPFVPEASLSQTILDRLEGALGGIAPRLVHFDRISHFAHGSRSFTFFLQPSNESIEVFREVQSALYAAFPAYNEQNTKGSDGLFHPHITLGQFSSKFSMQAKITEIMETFRPISCDLSHVSVITRGQNTPFAVYREVRLGTGKQLLAPTKESVVTQEGCEAEAEKIVEKLAGWVRARKKNLPRTTAKMMRSIEPMCTVRMKVPYDRVLMALLDKELIYCSGYDPQCAVEYLPALTAQDSRPEVDLFPEPVQHWVQVSVPSEYFDDLVRKEEREAARLRDVSPSGASPATGGGRGGAGLASPFRSSAKAGGSTYRSPFKVKYKSAYASAASARRAGGESDGDDGGSLGSSGEHTMSGGVEEWGREEERGGGGRDDEEHDATMDVEGHGENGSAAHASAEREEATRPRTAIRFPSAEDVDEMANGKAARWLARCLPSHRPATVKDLKSELVQVVTLKIQLDPALFLRRLIEDGHLSVDTRGRVSPSAAR